jgi:hypothetical protein
MSTTNPPRSPAEVVAAVHLEKGKNDLTVDVERAGLDSN